MAPRKRKAPEKKRRSLMAVLLSSTALGIGHAGRALLGLAARNPRPALIAAAFMAAFGSIAANALWYQPHRLASPLFATRDVAHFDALPGLRPAPKLSGDVTTYRIEQEGENPGVSPAAATPVRAAAAVPADAGADLKVASLPVAATVISQPENVALAVAVQQALIRKGLYDGVPDGVIGPRTSAAILAYEARAGLPQSGEVSDALLQSLSADGAAAKPVDEVADAINGAAGTPSDTAAVAAPAAKPTPKPASKPQHAASAAQPVVKVSGSSDDLASLIRADGAVKPAAAAPAHKASTAVASSDALTDPGAIRQIQRGLLKMDYPDIDPDGVAGEQTRAAIRQFEKYYGLPVTGVPSGRVLAKMQEIGAV